MFRYTFGFKMYGQGWTETLFRNSQLGVGEQYLLENYLQRRMNLMATDGRLTTIRSSNVNTQRDVQVLSDPTVLRTGTWAYGGSGTTADPGTETNAEDTFTALLLRLSDGGANFRPWSLLGLPDYVLQANIIDPAERPVLVSRLNNWMAAMSAASFGMKAQGVPTSSGRISVFFPKTPTNKLVCLGLRGTIPPIGSLVTLGGVLPWNKLNRTWRVASSTTGDDEADGYIYLSRSNSLDAYGDVQGGTYKTKTFGVSVLTQYSISRLTSRKTGVPFGTVRGRR